MLKPNYQDKDSIPEGLESFYKPNEDGSYTIQVEGMAAKSKVNEFRQNNIELQKKFEAIENKFSGFDIEQGKAAILELEKQKDKQLLNENGVDALVEQRTEKMRIDHSKQMMANKQAMTDLETSIVAKDLELSVLAIKSEVVSATQQLKTDQTPGILNDILLNAQQSFRHENGKNIPYDSEGNIIYNKSGVEAMSVNEWLESKQDSHYHWWGKSVSGGSVGGKISGGKRVMSQSDFTAGRLTEQDLKDINSGRLIIQ